MSVLFNISTSFKPEKFQLKYIILIFYCALHKFVHINVYDATFQTYTDKKENLALR